MNPAEPLRYDAVLKQLLQARPLQFLDALAGSPIVEILTVELPDVRHRRPDLLLRLRDGTILHIEVQAEPDPDMPWRMLEYYFLLRRLFRRPIIQIVLLLAEQGQSSELVLEEPTLHFRCEVTALAERDAAPLLASPDLNDQLLGLLARVSDPRGALRQVLEQIAAAPPTERAGRLAQLLVLSGLRSWRPLFAEEYRRMPTFIDPMEIPILNEILAERTRELTERSHEAEQRARQEGLEAGLRAGQDSGREEGERELLREAFESRFGILPEDVAVRLRSADAVTRLRWIRQAWSAPSLEEALR